MFECSSSIIRSRCLPATECNKPGTHPSGSPVTASAIRWLWIMISRSPRTEHGLFFLSESRGWLAKERPFKSLSRARLGNNVSCESGWLQHGHVCMCAIRARMHSKQKVWPHMLEKALTYISLQIGHTWSSVRSEAILDNALLLHVDYLMVARIHHSRKPITLLPNEGFRELFGVVPSHQLLRSYLASSNITYVSFEGIINEAYE